MLPKRILEFALGGNLDAVSEEIAHVREEPSAGTGLLLFEYIAERTIVIKEK